MTYTKAVQAIQAVQATPAEMNGRAHRYDRTGRVFVCRDRTRSRNGLTDLQNGTVKPFHSEDKHRNGLTVPVPFRARSPCFARPVANSDDHEDLDEDVEDIYGT